MTAPAPAPAPAQAPPASARVVHLVCSMDPDLSYCGMDMRALPVSPRSVTRSFPVCAVCTDLRDPLFGCPYCVKGDHKR